MRLLDFLRTADFAGIILGTTRHQIQQLLGDPPEWLVTGRKKGFQTSPIWRYGSIELYFAIETQHLFMIFSDHFPLVGCDTLCLDPWILRQYLPLEEALKQFDHAPLKYEIKSEQHTGTTQLLFASGVLLNFNAPDYQSPYQDGPLELTGFCLK